jgi:hypothetical protein
MLQPARALGAADLCSLIPKDIPLLSDIVKRVGCDPAVRGALSAAIAQALTPQPATPGGVAAPTPWYVPLAAVGGPQLVANCLCQGAKQGLPGQYMAPPAPPWYQNPWVIGGIVAGGLVLVLALGRPPAAAA